MTRSRSEPQPPVAPRAAPPATEPPDGDPGPAERIVTAWVLGCNRRPPSRIVNDVGRHVAEMLHDGIEPDDIRRAIDYWQGRGMHPNALPSVVNQVMNARPSNVVAITDRQSARPSTTDQRVRDGLALAAKFAEEELA